MKHSEANDSEFVALLTEHQSSLRYYVASLLPGDSAAADVAQQANATIWKKRDDFELGTNFKAWIFSIARYEVLNYRKKDSRDRLVFSEEMEDLIANELPERAGDFDLKQEALKGCLQKLKPADRDLIQHRYFEGTPLAEYSSEINRSVGSLKVTLHRIRNRLLHCVESKLATRKALES
ncbi:MAG: sigma-70 family RNA polymerase sigma factor [Verrucomicrobiales bacterium]